MAAWSAPPGRVGLARPASGAVARPSPVACRNARSTAL